MRRWKLLLAALCVLLLCGCGDQKRITGRVLSFEQGTLTVQTEKGKTYDFLVDSQETGIFDLVTIHGEKPLDSDCRVDVNWTRKQGKRCAEFIWIDARLQRDALQLSDGTSIDLWEYNGYRDYCLKDGTILLMEETPVWPDAASRWDELLYSEDFPEAAQQGIRAYYKEMGLRYDIPTLLEDAWLVYGLSEEYNAKLVGQHVSIEAWNDRIICCQMNLTLPRERTNGYADYFCEGAVFDRETGVGISNFDLFTLTPEELEAYLLDFLDNENIQLNLQPEQILLCRDGTIAFFLVDRTEENYSGMLHAVLSPEQAREILHPWAVIEPENNF